MKVEATEPGYYGGKRRDVGEEFGIADRTHFSKRWMQPVGWEPDDAAPVKAAPRLQPAPAKAAPEPIKASTETTVMQPSDPPKRVDPITGKDI